MAEDGEKRPGQVHQPCQREEEKDSGDHGKGQADDPRSVLLRPGELSAQDGDENDIVDAEYNFEPGERREGDPRLRSRDPGHKRLLALRRGVPVV